MNYSVNDIVFWRGVGAPRIIVGQVDNIEYEAIHVQWADYSTGWYPDADDFRELIHIYPPDHYREFYDLFE